MAAPSPSSEYLIWIDLEMTGLDPFNDVIIEIATIVTDAQLTTIAEGPVFAVHQPDTLLAGMDDWNQSHHSASGLIERVRSSPLDTSEAERLTLEFLQRYTVPKSSPMCGNSICQDRRFLARLMPELESHFHYRNLDVSTLKELAKRWAPEVAHAFKKDPVHRAMDDIRDSIRELQHYRDHLLRASTV